MACQAREVDMPYYPIVGLDEKAACLHYHNRRKSPRNGKVFLIDAGYSHNNYPSDITRTYATDAAPSEFRALIKAVENLEYVMAEHSKPGVTFGELQLETHVRIGQILLDAGIMKDITAEAAVEANLVRHFYPHGLGHMLGIFVHDVAGKQRDPIGTPLPPNKNAYLRNLRKLEAGFVVTVEPGIYFIDMLLDELKAKIEQANFNWALIEKLKPCGGIRIEDDIYVTQDGHANLTRPHLPWEYR
jgi:Xaa-Pro dipeptidase